MVDRWPEPVVSSYIGLRHSQQAGGTFPHGWSGLREFTT